MITIATSMLLMNSIIELPYSSIGNFTYDPPITNATLQESYNLKEWYNVPDEMIIVLPSGAWVINPTTPTTSIYGDIHKKGRMFYRIIGEPQL